jgi:hypothetical protein
MDKPPLSVKGVASAVERVGDIEDEDHAIQSAVDRAAAAVYQLAGSFDSCATQSLVLARVAAKLVDSMVSERQAEFLRSRFIRRHW